MNRVSLFALMVSLSAAPVADASLSTNSGDYVNVRDFIGINQPDGSTDNSTGAQVVATTLCARASNGGLVFIPNPPSAANYVFHDILNTCGNSWLGAGASGVGDSHQTATASIVLGGTSVDYSGATGYFMAWIVPGFPSFKSGNHVNGGGISGVSLRDGVSTATALVSEGTQDWGSKNVIINGAYNGVYMKGVENPVTSHISMWGTRNKNYEIVGDLSGQTQAGGACSTSNGDCSTRSDQWFAEYLSNIDDLGTNTVFTITGFVGDPTISHTSGEVPNVGMFVSCPSGLAADGSQCPQFGRFDDLQFEFFKTNGLLIEDARNFYFDHIYSVGNAASANNNFAAYSQNYTPTSAPAGRLQITNSQFFATGNDCIYLGGTMWDVSITNSEIYGCNSNNNGSVGIDSVGTLTNFKVIGNTIGTVDNYGGAFALARGVSVSPGTSNAVITNNIFGNVSTAVAPVANGSSSPWTIHEADNIGPGGAPVVGPCGTSPQLVNGSDRNMTVQVGTGSPAYCAITFGTKWSRAPGCTIQAAAGSAFASVTTSPSVVTIESPTSGGAYVVICGVN